MSGLQTQSNTNPLYRGPWDAIKKIYAQRGIAGIYKGQAVTLLREASGYGVYFLTYEKLVQWEMAKKGIRRDQIPIINAVGYGAAAGYAVSISLVNLYLNDKLSILLALGNHIPYRHGKVEDADRRIHTFNRSKVQIHSGLRSYGVENRGCWCLYSWNSANSNSVCGHRQLKYSDQLIWPLCKFAVCQWCNLCWIRTGNAGFR